MLDFHMNLQLFAGEKTEKATPRRREEARKKGQVAKSNEVITVMVLSITLLTLKIWLPYMHNNFKDIFLFSLELATIEITAESFYPIFLKLLVVLAKIMLPILITAFCAGLAANVVQIGFMFSSQPLKFDLNRINPLQGLKRIFSKRTIAELFKSILKTCLVGAVAFSYLYQEIPKFSILMDYPLEISGSYMGDVLFKICWRVILILLGIALVDFFFQRYEFEESIKMSKQEIKEEYKNIEGDPKIKAKIKEKQRQLATRRMMQEVPQATVVITNPTHIAVALKYKENMAVPLLVAKGQGLIASKIKEVAALHNVIVIENKPLARLIYKKVEVGSNIPAELYQGVAEILAYVYKIKGSF